MNLKTLLTSLPPDVIEYASNRTNTPAQVIAFFEVQYATRTEAPCGRWQRFMLSDSERTAIENEFIERFCFGGMCDWDLVMKFRNENLK